MAEWESYTSDKIIDIPEVNDKFNFKGRIAYRLYCDNTDTNNPVVRYEITYLHIALSHNTASSETVGSNVVAWNLGKYPTLFNEEQYNLNNDRDEQGNYNNPFAWPYEYSISYQGNESITDIVLAEQNNLDIIVGVSAESLFNQRYTIDYLNGSVGSDVTLLHGQVFSDTSKFDGINTNNQSKIYSDGTYLHIATSAVRQTSTNKILTYNEEFNVGIEDLTIESPYVGDECFASMEIAKSNIESRGLTRYAPSDFDVDDGISDPYVIHAYTPITSVWSKGLRQSIQEIKLQYEDFTIPEYPLPDPVLPFDDSTVYRLQKQYSGGNVVVDQNGNPILAWIKCPKIGQE